MPSITFKRIILHELPDNQGWQIIGVRGNPPRQEVIATFTSVVDRLQAERVADQLAKNLAGQYAAEID